MSVKFEIDSLDAELLAMLKKSKASRVLSWDVVLSAGVTMRVSIDYPLTHSAPAALTDAVNECIGKCVEASNTPLTPPRTDEFKKLWAQVQDAETALITYDEGRNSEYWLRHPRLSVPTELPQSEKP